MKKKKRMDFGGLISGLFGTNGNSDPIENYIAQRYNKMTNNPGFIESPDSTLTDNNIRQTRALRKTEFNPLTTGLDFIGTGAMQYGTSMINSGITDFTPDGNNASTNGFSGWLNNLFSSKQIKAFGGKVNNMVEVEGEEVGELPNGDLLNFEGPSHETGGIDVNLPSGTEIFSKRIKVDGKTMAQRKKLREKKEKFIEDILGKNPTDVLLKNTLNRTKTTNTIEDTNDTNIQDIVGEIVNNKEKFALGGNVDSLEPVTLEPKGLQLTDIKLPDTFKNPLPLAEVPQESNNKWNWLNLGSGTPTFGDSLGILGNLKQAFDPYFNTLENRTGDTPNINPFKEYGKDGLKTLESAKDYLTGVKDQTLKNLNLTRGAAIKRNNNSARGIGTSRAANIATDAIFNNSMEDVHSDFANKMFGVASQEAQMQNQRDGIVMQGEGQADLADRQDRDNFYKQMGRDKQAIGEVISRTGKNINDIKERGVNEEFLNSIFNYVKANVNSGKISQKDVKLVEDAVKDTGIETTGNTSKKENIPDSTWNNSRNPETGKPFSSLKEYKDYVSNYEKTKTRYSSPLSLEEINKDYKNFVDPLTGKPFDSNVSYQEYLGTTGSKPELKPYSRLTGSKLNKKLKIDEIKPVLEKFLNENNMELNLDDAVQIKTLQKLLGTGIDGDFGEKTLKALKAYKKK